MTLAGLNIRKKRAVLVDAKLKKLFPDAHIALNFSNNWELLVAVVLSAQCTDVAVNKCTQRLFTKYPKFEDYLNADPKQFAKDISSITFFNNKAKNILETARIIHSSFEDKVPKEMSELLKLKGVARKTANIIQGNGFGIVEGIAVDTHVRRFALKLELSASTDPVKIENDLMQLLPKEDWFGFTYRIIDYGRNICPARKHDCLNHPLSLIYPPAANIWP